MQTFALATYTYAAYLFSNKKELCLSGCPVPPPAPPIFNGYYTPTYGGGYGGNIGSAWGNNFTPGGCDATIHVLTAYVQGMPVEWKDGCGNWHYF